LSGFLLDTNVISDLVKPRPNAGLQAWVEARDEESLFVSVLTLGEIRQGIEMAASDARKRARLERVLGDFRARFTGRVLSVDHLVAETWGEISGRARGRGAPLSVVDALLAATALVHRLIVVTANARHFDRTGAQVLNPFSR
jgi:predicted nucleic acid-binding protein